MRYTYTCSSRSARAPRLSPVRYFSTRFTPLRSSWRHITSASLAATITGTPERAVPDGYYWLTVATNWDEAGREETSPENDYTNNEVRGLLRTYYAGRTSAWRSQRRCGSAACRRGRRRSAAASSRSGARSSRARGLSRICAAGSAAWCMERPRSEIHIPAARHWRESNSKLKGCNPVGWQQKRTPSAVSVCCSFVAVI